MTLECNYFTRVSWTHKESLTISRVITDWREDCQSIMITIFLYMVWMEILLVISPAHLSFCLLWSSFQSWKFIGLSPCKLVKGIDHNVPRWWVNDLNPDCSCGHFHNPTGKYKTDGHHWPVMEWPNPARTNWEKLWPTCAREVGWQAIIQNLGKLVP